MRIRLVATLLGAALVTMPAQTPTDEVERIVRDEMARQQVPGVAVAVVRGGRVVSAAGYGLANVEHDVPVTSATIFQSGLHRQAVHGGCSSTRPSSSTARRLRTRASWHSAYTLSSSTDGSSGTKTGQPVRAPGLSLRDQTADERRFFRARALQDLTVT